MFANRSHTFTRNLHVILAMAFLFVMLVEWGSHNLAFAHSGYPAGMVSVSARDDGHDDPCKSLTCCQNRKEGGSVLSPSHHLPSYNSYSEILQFVPAYSRDFVAQASPREDVHGIFRPKDPLLHPPEFS
ncbi:MAG: hypothetical protein ABL984_07455 [Pyrinomonadaceae bacterium]